MREQSCVPDNPSPAAASELPRASSMLAAAFCHETDPVWNVSLPTDTFTGVRQRLCRQLKYTVEQDKTDDLSEETIKEEVHLASKETNKQTTRAVQRDLKT